MKLRTALIVVAALALFAAILVLNRPSAAPAQSRRAGAGGPPEWRQERFVRVDEAADAARDNDPSAVRALADEIFSQAHQFGTLPRTIKNLVEERVLRAEMNYRLGEGPGVTDAAVAHTINWLADKLAMPDYARTSEHQALDFRFRTLLSTPQFMGAGMSREESGAPLKIGDSVNPTMSPLQACYLLMFAIDEKLGNAKYQMTPQEWEATRYAKAVRAWEAYGRERAAGRGSVAAQYRAAKPKLVALISKQTEMMRAVRAGLGSLSADESIGLAQSALDVLGIPAGQ